MRAYNPPNFTPQPNERTFPMWRDWWLGNFNRFYKYTLDWLNDLTNTVNGGLTMTLTVITNASSPYAVAAMGNQFIAASAGVASDTIIDLFAAQGTGDLVTIKKIDANAFNIVVTPNGTDTIDGQTTDTLTQQWESRTYLDYSAGKWAII